MKKHLLSFALFLLSTTQTKAQTSVYHPFPDSDAVWSVSHSGYECYDCYNRNYYISGDTIIKSLTYHKIDYLGWFGFPDYITQYCNNSNQVNSGGHLGAIRQDINYKTVYIILSGDTTENLLYDFSLNVGDTLKTFEGDMPIVTIDSVLIGSNYRKRFNSNSYFVNSLIEGIGNTSGLMEGLGGSFFECGGYLACFSQNNQTLYPDTTPCNLLLNVNNLISEIYISIFPNPASNLLSIQTTSFRNEAVTVSIMNVLGEKVLTNSFSFAYGKAEIPNIADLSSGVYFVQLSTEKTSWVGKFIKE